MKTPRKQAVSKPLADPGLLPSGVKAATRKGERASREPASQVSKTKANRGGKGGIVRLTNGTTINRRRLVLGNLPRELLAVRNEGRAYRRELEAEVLRVKGEIDVTSAHLIDTATAATAHAGICRHLLRKKIGSMTTSDVLACSREITKAKAARDAAVRALGLDVEPEPMTLDRYVLQAKKGDAE